MKTISIKIFIIPQSKQNYASFEKIFLSILEEHAPLKKKLLNKSKKASDTKRFWKNIQPLFSENRKIKNKTALVDENENDLMVLLN